MTRRAWICFIVCSFLPTAWSGADTRSSQFLSKTFHVDRIYRSMEGPYETKPIRLWESDKPELLWITAIRSEIVDAEGKQTLSGEFMCHVNMDIDPARHRDRFHLHKPYVNPRLMTLAQGQFSVEFPPGFGAPLMSDEPLYMNSQVLNHNIDDRVFDVRHRITVDFVRDSELTQPMKPLFVSAPFGMKLVKGDLGYFSVSADDPAIHGPGCSVGEPADNVTAGSIFDDRFGRQFTGHWKVKPGREINHTPVTSLMALPFDTTIHYIAVHLHPFAEYVELRDLTADRVVFRSNAKNATQGIGLVSVDTYSSIEGIPVYKDHEYELVSAYNNPTNEDRDAMATVFLYLLDREFRRPGT